MRPKPRPYRLDVGRFLLLAVERELRGQILDGYLADYERRHGPLPVELQDQARQVFDEVFTEDARWPAAS
jgi:hypothetical protein